MIDNIRRIIALAPQSCTITMGFRLLRERAPEEIDAWIAKDFRKKITYDVSSMFMDWAVLSIQRSRFPPVPGGGRRGQMHPSALFPLLCAWYSRAAMYPSVPVMTMQ